MVTDTMLVWHIATTICKHNFFALEKGEKQIAMLSNDDSNVIFTASSLLDEGGFT
jgi:hypothetical protein